METRRQIGIGIIIALIVMIGGVDVAMPPRPINNTTTEMTA